MVHHFLDTKVLLGVFRSLNFKIGSIFVNHSILKTMLNILPGIFEDDPHFDEFAIP